MELGREKFNILAKIVGLFETKFSATIFTLLTVAVIWLSIENNRLGNDLVKSKDDLNKFQSKMYEMVILEVRKQIAPIKETNKSTSDSVKVVIKEVKTVIKSVNQKLK